MENAKDPEEEKRLTYKAMSVYKEPFFTAVALHREEFVAVAVHEGKVSTHTVLEYPREMHQQDGDIWTEIRLVAVPNGEAENHTQLPWHQAHGHRPRTLAWSVPEFVPRTVEMFDWWLNTVMKEAADFESLNGKTMKEAFEIVKPRPTRPHK